MHPDSALLHHKRSQLHTIVTRRKRKLEELYTVSHTLSTPRPTYSLDSNSGNSDHELQKHHFLTALDIDLGRTVSEDVLLQYGVGPVAVGRGASVAEQNAPSSLHIADEDDNKENRLAGHGQDAKTTKRLDVRSASNTVNGSRTPSPATHTTAITIDTPPQTSSESSAVDPKSFVDAEERLDVPVRANQSVSPVKNGENVVLNGPTRPSGVISTTPVSNESPAQVNLESRTPEKSSTVKQDARSLESAIKQPQQPNGSIHVPVPGQTLPETSTTDSSTPRDGFTHPKRTPMRIDTTVARQPSILNEGSLFRTPSAIQHTPSADRMTTRVSSGVLRQRSVSEILGETPRTAYPPVRPPGLESRAGSVANTQPGSRPQTGDASTRDHSRSTVVFARSHAESGPGSARTPQKSDEERDYMRTYFTTLAAQPSLNTLIGSARKVMTTDEQMMDFRELQKSQVLKRVYKSQQKGTWSLRQHVRADEPPRPSTSWDVLIAEARWLRTDFREERKWKYVVAKSLAEWCAGYVNADEGVRSDLRVKFRAPTLLDTERAETVESMELDHDSADQDDSGPQTPDLSRPAQMIFSLPQSEVIFGLQKTEASDDLLAKLPDYDSITGIESERRITDTLASRLDAAWKTNLVPVSKFATQKVELKDPATPKKRDRFLHFDELESLHGEIVPVKTESTKQKRLPERSDIAMFNPANKHIMTRIYASHVFKPPSEFNMPTQAFFESRISSQWTRAEDEELKRLVKQYEYNWSLVSSVLSTPGMLVSQAERRTPWECFERWVSFEGLPGEMGKHQYFKAWESRRTNARHKLENQAQQREQLVNATPIRKRSSEPMSMERRRNSKHLAMLAAIQRVMKKKENMAQRQQAQHSTQSARPPQEPNTSRLQMKTPQEFSAHKFKQECDFREKQAQFKRQVQMQQNQTLMTQAARAQAAANGTPMNPAQVQAYNQLPQAVQLNIAAAAANSRPSTSMNAHVNGVSNTNGAMNPSGRPMPTQAQLQSYLQTQQRLAQSGNADSAQVLLQAQRLQDQQRMMAARQQHLANGTASLTSAQNQALISALQSQLQHQPGKISPAGTHHRMNSSSPAMASSNLAGTSSSSTSMVPILQQIQTHLQKSNPTLPPEKIQQLATMALNSRLAKSNSMPATLQNGLSSYNAPGQGQGQGQQATPNQTTAMYAQFMRQQQSSQQNRIASAIAAASGHANTNNNNTNPSANSNANVNASANGGDHQQGSPAMNVPLNGNGHAHRPDSASSHPPSRNGPGSLLNMTLGVNGHTTPTVQQNIPLGGHGNGHLLGLSQHTSTPVPVPLGGATPKSSGRGAAS